RGPRTPIRKQSLVVVLISAPEVNSAGLRPERHTEHSLPRRPSGCGVPQVRETRSYQGASDTIAAVCALLTAAGKRDSCCDIVMESARRSVNSAAGPPFEESRRAVVAGSGQPGRLVQRIVERIDQLAIWRIAAQLPEHHTAERKLQDVVRLVLHDLGAVERPEGGPIEQPGCARFAVPIPLVPATC